MKKQLRKAMICTVAMMLVAVLTLTGVTYAWFSESKDANVNALNFNVLESKGGVYISTDGYTPTSFTNTLMLDVGTDTYVPVSTAGEFYTATEYLDGDGKPRFADRLKFFTGKLSGPYDETVQIEPLLPTDKAAHYIEQDVYFDNTTGASDITISLAGTTITPVAKEGVVSKDIHYATRVAVVTRGAITPKDLFPTEEEQKQPDFVRKDYDDTPKSIQIFENNAGVHTVSGMREWKELPDYDSAATKYTYYGLRAATTAEQNNLGGVNRFKSVNSNTTNFKKMETISTDSEVLITVPAGHYLKTTIYIWIEGQDVDCQNDVSGQTFSANVKFTLVSGGAAGGEAESGESQ